MVLLRGWGYPKENHIASSLHPVQILGPLICMCNCCIQCLDAGLERCCLAFSRLCLLQKGVYAVLGIALSCSAITKLPVDGIRPIVDLHQDCYEAATGAAGPVEGAEGPAKVEAAGEEPAGDSRGGLEERHPATGCAGAGTT